MLTEEEEEGEEDGGRVEELTNQIAVPSEETPPNEELVAMIQEAMWRFCHPYSINDSVS